MASFGTPVSGLKSLLNANTDDRKKFQKGIPADSANNELKEWIRFASLGNSKVEVAIKADMNVSYPVVEQVIETLKDLNINKFKFVTSLETK